ncbi:hypothetical protein ACTQ6A_14005 [Lachnospiraceae bacterium LCP25S3_G4]
MDRNQEVVFRMEEETVEFNQALYEKNLEENTFTDDMEGEDKNAEN